MEETSIFILTMEETSITAWKKLPFMSKRTVSRPENDDTTYPLKVPRKLGGRLAAGAKKAGIKKRDFARVSLRRGAEWLSGVLDSQQLGMGSGGKRKEGGSKIQTKTK
jgi:hypothetical protein